MFKTMPCPNCGSENLQSNLFCAQCGARLAPDSAPLHEAPLPGQAPASPPLDRSGTGSLPSPSQAPTYAANPSPNNSSATASAIPLVPPRAGAPPTAYQPTDQPANPARQADRVPGWYAPPPAPAEVAAGRYAAAVRPALPAHGSLAAAPAPMGSMMACGVCGTSLYPGQAACSRCKTRPGFLVNPNDPTATNDLPFGPPVKLAALFRTGNQEPAKPEERLSGWNWGAALLPTIWAARHRLYWQTGVSALLTVLLTALYLIRAALDRTPDASGTLTGFLVICALLFGAPRSLYAARRGNTLALRSGIYADVDALLKSQRRWAVWAIIGVSITALALGLASRMLSSL